jgi:hypothetical protein
MPAASPLEAIEVAVATQLATIEDLKSVTIAPLVDVFPIDDDGYVSISNAILPDAYPGAVLSLNDEDITIEMEDRTIGPSTRSNTYRAPVFVAVYAQSDGTTEKDARWLAWDLAHQVIVSLGGFIPEGAPEPWRIRMDERMEPGAITSILIDANTHAMLVRFYAKYHFVSQ